MSTRKRTVRQLDFSLNQLTEVPLEDLIGSPEFTHVDLSCNLLQTLPNEFSTLIHLVRIDLSKNKLKSIPSDFGNLVNLKYLDLYDNEIEQLPVSFCKLKNLQWLDLKNNPLNSPLKKIAGDCLDAEGCQDCAKKVVTYYRALKKDLDVREAKKLKKAIEKDALEKAKKENEMLEQRKLRKQIKEQRRLEMKKTEEALKQSQSGKDFIEEQKGHVSGNKDNTAQFRQIWDLKKMAFIFVVIFAVILTIMMVCAVIFLKPIENKDVEDFKENVVAFMNKFMLKIKVLAAKMMSLIISNVPKFRAAFLKFVHACMESVTHYTSLLESMLSVYF